ncbi:MAG: GNAT family N-acetyltransferase [Gemmatimonadaceae bacterium]
MSDGSRVVVRRATGADVRGIATVQVLSWRATYRGIVDDAYIDSLTIDGREERWRHLFEAAPVAGHDIFVAETRAAGVIGFVSGGPLREPGLSPGRDAELYAIYLLPGEERRGLGRALVAVLARAVAAAGHRGMLVQVLSGNAPARRFYEALGARFLLERPLSIGGRPYPESVYEWNEITTLGAKPKM